MLLFFLEYTLDWKEAIELQVSLGRCYAEQRRWPVPFAPVRCASVVFNVRTHVELIRKHTTRFSFLWKDKNGISSFDRARHERRHRLSLVEIWSISTRSRSSHALGLSRQPSSLHRDIQASKEDRWHWSVASISRTVFASKMNMCSQEHYLRTEHLNSAELRVTSSDWDNDDSAHRRWCKNGTCGQIVRFDSFRFSRPWCHFSQGPGTTATL